MNNVADITERKLVEEARQSSELRYRRLFESAKDGILILDADSGQIVDVNPYLMEEHRGTIEIETGPGKGAAVRITLPATDEGIEVAA